MSCCRWNESIQTNKNEDICCGCVYFVLNDAPHTNLSDGYRVEVKYTQYFYIYSTSVYEPLDHRIVANFSYYISGCFDVIVI